MDTPPITPTRIAAWLRLWNALVSLVVGAATGALVALFGPLLFVSLLSLPVRLAEGPIVLGILVFFLFGFLVGAPIALAWGRRGGASLAVGFVGGHVCVTTWFATAWLSILHLLDSPFDVSQAAGWITLFLQRLSAPFVVTGAIAALAAKVWDHPAKVDKNL